MRSSLIIDIIIYQNLPTLTSKENFMQVVIEFLPVFFGAIIARLLLFIKPLLFKNVSLILLLLISGIEVNLLNKKGIELISLDILASFVSAFSFILLPKYLTLFRSVD